MLLSTLRKVKAIPPPMIISLTLSNMLLISWILSATLALEGKARIITTRTRGYRGTETAKCPTKWQKHWLNKSAYVSLTPKASSLLRNPVSSQRAKKTYYHLKEPWFPNWSILPLPPPKTVEINYAWARLLTVGFPELTQKCLNSTVRIRLYEDCPEKVQPLLI